MSSAVVLQQPVPGQPDAAGVVAPATAAGPPALVAHGRSAVGTRRRISDVPGAHGVGVGRLLWREQAQYAGRGHLACRDVGAAQVREAPRQVDDVALVRRPYGTSSITAAPAGWPRLP